MESKFKDQKTFQHLPNTNSSEHCASTNSKRTLVHQLCFHLKRPQHDNHSRNSNHILQKIPFQTRFLYKPPFKKYECPLTAYSKTQSDV